ncbi:MAG: hypothetical protein R2751_07295 [Bacteroidales bacterium]
MIQSFLQSHALRAEDINFHALVGSLLKEMENGLAGTPSSLPMIPTYIGAENEFQREKSVLAIDAGGTNFRAALLTFDKKGQVHVEGLSKFLMPGIQGEISAKKFFETMAGYVRPLAEKCDRIGFCFSYPTEILPNKDGRLLQFTKEVQAPEVIGRMIGEGLLEALGTPDKKIVLLNDTVATLLAGLSAHPDKTYDSFIGFILGTGTNTCYVEANRNIAKNPGLDPEGNMIINMESGSFALLPVTTFDRQFDATTVNPGSYLNEKMLAGGYFGGLCLTVLKGAAAEGLFSAVAEAKVTALPSLTSEEASLFSQSGEGPLKQVFTEGKDVEGARRIVDCLIDRASCLAAATIAAPVLKTGKGKDAAAPILITIEGSTFYKLNGMKARFEHHLSTYLSGERKRYLAYAAVENSSLLGAAMAGLVE